MVLIRKTKYLFTNENESYTTGTNLTESINKLIKQLGNYLI